jgi:hypothetical protein
MKAAGVGFGESAPGVLCEEEGAREEQGDQPVPLVLGELADRTDVLEARVCHHEIQPPEALHRPIDRGPVPARVVRSAPKGSPGPVRLGLDVDGQHLRAVGLEPRSDCAADPARGPGHERDAPLGGPDRVRPVRVRMPVGRPSWRPSSYTAAWPSPPAGLGRGTGVSLVAPVRLRCVDLVSLDDTKLTR